MNHFICFNDNLLVIWFCFDAVKPPRSGPSETALHLRSLPEEGSSIGEKFSELTVKINDLSMEIIIILWYLPVYFWSNANDDHEKYV